MSLVTCFQREGGMGSKGRLSTCRLYRLRRIADFHGEIMGQSMAYLA